MPEPTRLPSLTRTMKPNEYMHLRVGNFDIYLRAVRRQKNGAVRLTVMAPKEVVIMRGGVKQTPEPIAEGRSSK